MMEGIHKHCAAVCMREARVRRQLGNQPEYVSSLVGWARNQMHKHIRATRTVQRELF